jgi:hypothetical protein
MPWLRWISLCVLCDLLWRKLSWIGLRGYAIHNLGESGGVSCFELLAKDDGEPGFVESFFRNGNHGVVEFGVGEA